ncbi:hypothetical protein CFC21_046479 [Triticum aestivum]|uniref:Uncharacterized protein n=2 Tax=Triticum aestivum TaxID=4565 RepID=A0A3B6GT94_WHEAT|nr:hypothetical protein CFC21_046479 [Triticum aestivum]
MASAVPWKPLYWQRIRDASVLADAARDRLAAVALDLVPLPPRAVDVAHAVSLIGDCEEKLAEAGKFLGFLLSSLGTVEILALRRMWSDDALEQQLRPRARQASASAGAAYDDVASSRGHLGAARRLLAPGDLLRPHVDRQVLAAARDVAAAVEQLHGVEAALRTGGDLALPRALLPRSADPITRTAEAAAHPGAKRPREHGDAWRAVARSVPATLLQACAHLPELEAAHAELARCADALETSTSERAVVLAFVAAHTALSRVLAAFAGANTAFFLSTSQLGLNDGGPRWRSLEVSRADAERHGRAALDLLWSASACLDYLFAGVLAWSDFKSREADELLRRSVAEAGEAVDAANSMCAAGGRIFLSSCTIIGTAVVPTSRRFLAF